ncbi:hypothetical protein [Bradyrhizobium sp. AZCC 2289]|uniref:hypothetical protein n=1 Tax=Bradyrhizobium sp. AZCC 2289 TaxID=3117026 RepID=UPI002FF3254D
MEIVLFWIGLSIVVGVAANARGREGILWFFLALVISPLIALLAVLVMERKNAPAAAGGTAPTAFEPDAVHAGIPYRMQSDGSIEAIMQGARVRFSDYAKFAAATGAALPPPAPPSPHRPLETLRSPGLTGCFKRSKK